MIATEPDTVFIPINAAGKEFTVNAFPEIKITVLEIIDGPGCNGESFPRGQQSFFPPLIVATLDINGIKVNITHMAGIARHQSFPMGKFKLEFCGVKIKDNMTYLICKFSINSD